VKDPSQGAVPEAQVVLTRVEDKLQYPAKTDADGTFHFVNLKPGHYDLAISASGFAEFKISSAQLDARQTLRFDVALKLASASQSIEVGGDAGPVINTENATIGDTKDFSQITNLPVNYRGATTSPLAVLATVPGAQQDANGNVSVGGGLPSQVQYSVDGSSTVNIRQNGALGNMNPSSELISEFKVTQFNNNGQCPASWFPRNHQHSVFHRAKLFARCFLASVCACGIRQHSWSRSRPSPVLQKEFSAAARVCLPSVWK